MGGAAPEPFNLCVECARRGETCCQRVEIFVSLGDVTRITAHTGDADFCEWRDEEVPGYYQPEDDPVWYYGTIRADGQRRVLRQQANGDCIFLTPTGCELPLEVRPLVCRLYPYDYGEQGPTEVITEQCPMDLLPEGVTLPECLGVPEESFRRWHAMLYEEIRRELPSRD
jgi:uncharacterized protein